MARPLRLLIEDGIYHVTSRGLEAIYRHDSDRRAFLVLLGRTIGRFDWRCLTYCLMDNHFHLLVRTPQANLSIGMRHLKSAYAQSYNRRHERRGPLFEGRFAARLVQQDAHLLQVFRYIALNPVSAGLCAGAEEWEWSGHRALSGRVAAPPWLAAAESCTWFSEKSHQAGRRAYRDFVAGPAEEPRDVSGAALGSSEFLRAVLPDTRPGPDIPEHDWGPGRPPLDELLAGTAGAEGIALAHRHHGYTMQRIADALGCHVSTVSRRLRRYEQQTLECKT